jgi:transposase
LSYETLDGNRADVSTMETMLRMVERKYGKARRIWVFDRGIVSEQNLAAIRKRGGQYLVGTPRSQMKQWDAELAKESAEDYHTGPAEGPQPDGATAGENPSAPSVGQRSL